MNKKRTTQSHLICVPEMGQYFFCSFLRLFRFRCVRLILDCLTFISCIARVASASVDLAQANVTPCTRAHSHCAVCQPNETRTKWANANAHDVVVFAIFHLCRCCRSTEKHLRWFDDVIVFFLLRFNRISRIINFQEQKHSLLLFLIFAFQWFLCRFVLSTVSYIWIYAFRLTLRASWDFNVSTTDFHLCIRLSSIWDFFFEFKLIHWRFARPRVFVECFAFFCRQ